MVTCPNCQKPVREGAKFCASCGAPLVNRMTTPRTAQTAATRPLVGSMLPPAQSPAGHATRPVSASGAQTRQLVPAGTNTSGPRPQNALLGDMYRVSGLLYNNAGRMIYSVTEFPARPDTMALQCPGCGAIHWKDAYLASELAYPPATCDLCLTQMDPDHHPSLVAIEVFDPKLLGRAPEVVPLLLSNKNVRAPIFAVTEMVCGRARTVMVEPRVDPLPEKVERSQAVKWFADMVEGLDYLHNREVSFNGQAINNNLAIDGASLVWAHFSSCAVGPVSENARRADVRALATRLWQWLTGREQYAQDSSLSAGENAFFSQALTGQGFSTVAELGKAFENSQAEAHPRLSVEFRTGRRTDVGRIRELNEDSLLTIETSRITTSNPHPAGVYVVADGMGGHSAGEVASGAIVNYIQARCLGELGSAVSSAGVDWLAWIKQTVEMANKQVFDMRKATGTDMGSTLVMAMVEGQHAYIAHVGDSRAYLVTDREIRRLTVDHSLVERLVATGQIRPEDAQNHPQKNVIYRTVGDKPRLDVDAKVVDLAVGDRLLLCSDGLCGMVTDDVIHKTVISAADPQSACDALVAAANHAGGDDNISVVIVQIVKA